MEYTRTNLKWNGWGWANEKFIFPNDESQFWKYLKNKLGIDEFANTPSIEIDKIYLPECKIPESVMQDLSRILDNDRIKTDRFERIFHSKGRSYHDLLYIRSGKLDSVPDVILYPQNSEEIQKIIEIANNNNLALIPFGGGSSVVGGVNAIRNFEQKGIITVDVTLMNKLISIDEESHTATFQAGIYGPNLEKILQEKGYTLGHYPQSFEFSTLGGWISARGAGQQSNRYGKAEEFLVSAKLITPRGELKTLPLPASSSGPNLNQIIAGSEGTLGIITEATVKIHKLPKVKEYWGILFNNFENGSNAVRRIVQSNIPVAMIRLSDEDETEFLLQFTRQSGDTPIWEDGIVKKFMESKNFRMKGSLMILGLEGDWSQVYLSLLKIMKICISKSGFILGKKVGENWYKSRFSTPYLRDDMLNRGIGVDTLETSTEWSNIMNLHSAVKSAIIKGISKENHKGAVMAHISHSYEDGASLYFTFVFPMNKGNEISQWIEIKREASESIIKNGGTISHHHGIGVDHIEWLKEEKGKVGMELLKAMKKELDPNDIMNPRKLYSDLYG